MKKKNSIKLLLRLLLSLLIVMALLPLLAKAQPMLGQSLQETQRVDSLKQEPVWQERRFSAEKLQELQEDGSLTYEIATAEDNWWSRLKRWFIIKLSEMFSGASRAGVLDWIVYIICIGAGVFLIFRFMDIDLTALVQRRAARLAVGVHEGISENIHALDYEQELQIAVQQKEFKRAVRLLYLASLKRLSDKGLVRWEPGKTNRQYQRELRSADRGKHFASLGYFFEYAWYGDFPVNEQLYQQVEQEYQQFCKQVEVKA